MRLVASQKYLEYIDMQKLIKFGLDCSYKWYQHITRNVEENDYKLWDFNIQTDQEIHQQRPDVSVIIANNKRTEPAIVDIAAPGGNNVGTEMQQVPR